MLLGVADAHSESPRSTENRTRVCGVVIYLTGRHLALSLEGHGFSTEVAAPPASIKSALELCGHLGFSFIDFHYENEGRADVWVRGLQLGTCLSPRGVTLEVGSKIQPLEEDMVIARTPGSVSVSRWQKGFHGHFLFFAPDAVERFFFTPLSRIPFGWQDMALPAREAPTAVHILAAIAGEIANGHLEGPTLIESLSANALRSVIRLPSESERSQGSLTVSQSKTLRDLIIERSNEDLSLVSLAAAVDLSVAHMLRGFKQTFGVTPHRFIVRARLDSAVHLLKTTRMNLDDVAVEAGFKTKTQMARTFRSVLGFTPRDVRSSRQ